MSRHLSTGFGTMLHKSFPFLEPHCLKRATGFLKEELINFPHPISCTFRALHLGIKFNAKYMEVPPNDTGRNKNSFLVEGFFYRVVNEHEKNRLEQFCDIYLEVVLFLP